MLRTRLGAMMQRQRQRLGMTQADLAESANLSLKYIGEVERGEANVTVDALEGIATALQWDPWELFSLERRPISQEVHQLVMQELTHVRTRLDSLCDWLRALDPALRPPSDVVPPLDSTMLQLAGDTPLPTGEPVRLRDRPTRPRAR